MACAVDQLPIKSRSLLHRHSSRRETRAVMADELPDRSTVLALEPHQLPAYFDSLARIIIIEVDSGPRGEEGGAGRLITSKGPVVQGEFYAARPLDRARSRAAPAAGLLRLARSPESVQPRQQERPRGSTCRRASPSHSMCHHHHHRGRFRSERGRRRRGSTDHSPSRRGKPCGHVFRPGESVYRCRDCGVDPTCVLCFDVSSSSSSRSIPVREGKKAARVD
jgi:hypothetical protein